MLRISPPTWIVTAFIAASVMRLVETDAHAIAAEILSEAFSEAENEVATTEKPIKGTADQHEALIQTILDAQEKIKKREAAVLTKERDLIALQEAIQVQIETLTTAEERLSAKLRVATDIAEEDVTRLAKMYENMKPETAADVFSKMEPDFAAGFIRRLPEDIAASILSELPPEMAYSISVTLAGQHHSLARQ